MESPLIDYMREVLDEHTLPLADKGASLVEAAWLVDMIHKTEECYKTNEPKP
jgi:hypothetical protein